MDNRQQIRLHITKEQRLPKCFKEVEKILKSVKSCQKNYKTILANSRLRGNIHKKVYSMTVNVLKNYNYIQKIMDKIQLLEKEKYLRREIASVLIYELIFGHGFLPGESKIVKTVQLYESDIFRAHEILQNTFEDSLNAGINIPRYVRVHTLVTTVPYVIKDLITCGFHHVVYDDDLSETKYLELVKNLKSGSFLIDFHFKDVLVFEHHENLISLELYKNNHIILQDKSSYIPVQVLDPKPYGAVLDACAAPGMKTIHIAAKMKNKGLLIACERDKDRFECLKKMLDSGSVKICKTLCKDFKLIDPCDQAYSNIEYILLDPSCSGSGMVNRLDEITDTEDSKNKERLMKLAGFQIILLKHSLKFPSVKRVVYSTCSIHEEENEYVVHEALKAFDRTFKLMPAMPEWSCRGSEKYEFGKLCLRTDPKVHLTNGFFVAVFERITNNEYTEEYQSDYYNHDSTSHKKHKKKSLKPEESSGNEASEGHVDINFKPECNSSDLFETHYMNDSEHIALFNKEGESTENSIQNVNSEQEQTLINTQEISKKHKKKKKDKSKEYSCQTNELNIEIPNEHSKFKEHSQILVSENNNYPYTCKVKEKLKKEYEFKHNLSEDVKVTENSIQNLNYEQEQHVMNTQNVNKKHKKKKKDKSKEYSCQTNELNVEIPNEHSKFKEHSQILVSENDDYPYTCKAKEKLKKEYEFKYNLSEDVKITENSIQNLNYEQEQHLKNTQNVNKKHKKKKKDKSKECSYETNALNIELPNEPVLKHSKLEEYSQSSLSENNDNSYTCKIKEKRKKNKGDKLSENVEVTEKFENVTKLHRKKKKDHSTILLQSEEKSLQNLSEPNLFSVQKGNTSTIKQGDDATQSEMKNTSVAHFMNESTQNKHLKNLDFNESSEEFVNTFSHKKKRKKEHLKMDDDQSCKKLNANYTPLSHIDSHQSIADVSEINDAAENVADLTWSNKKKKKKHKRNSYSLESEM